jgi:hypothetical protein
MQFGELPDTLMITEWINLKKTPEEIKDLMYAKDTKLESSAEDLKKVFFEIILGRSKKTLEHVKRLCDHFHTILYPMISGSEESQLMAIKMVAKMWEKDEVKLQQTLNRLYQIRLVDAKALIEWVFTQIETVGPRYPSNFSVEFKLLAGTLG